MSTEDDLLAQIRANPRDNQLRQVYADLLIARGDARGEYIQVLTTDERSWSEPQRERWRELSRRERAWNAELGLGGFDSVSWPG